MDWDSADDHPLFKAKTNRPKLKALDDSSDDDEPLAKKQKAPVAQCPKNATIKSIKVKKEKKEKKAKSDPQGLVKVEDGTSKKSGRIKKQYEKPGQKFDEPNHLDCLRLFYESLYHEEKERLGTQSGSLSMAEQWCMERGLFTHEEHEVLFKRHVRAV